MIFAKLFEKKPNEKAVIRFWKDFENRSEFYLDVLVNDDEDSEDYYFVRSCLKEGLKKCCKDATVAYDFSFNRESDPMRFVFYHRGDDYLKKAADCLAAHFPESLKEKMLFVTAE